MPSRAANPGRKNGVKYDVPADAPEGFELRVAEYALPTVPEGRVVVVIVSVDGVGGVDF